MLEIRGLSKELGAFSMRNVTFEVAEGEYFVLLGASGVGKTVLLETIAGLMKPEAGQIMLDGRDVTWVGPQNRKIGIVYQDQALFPHLSVYQNIAYGLRCRKLGGLAVRKRVGELAEQVGVSQLLNRGVETLSGGEAQRVSLARTLATDPRCLLLDEPISSLDVASRGEMRSLLRNLNRRGQTMLHVTHDYEEALSLASRIAVMENGRIAQVDAPEAIFHNPQSEFVASFVGIKNFFSGTLTASDDGGQLCHFTTREGVTFSVLSKEAAGPGCIIFRSEDVLISMKRPETSARNVFDGVVLDIIPAALGVEVSIEIGVRISAILTRSSVKNLAFSIGDKVCVHFKAGACRFLPE